MITKYIHFKKRTTQQQQQQQQQHTHTHTHLHSLAQLKYIH
jgi:hypothetical protein